LLQNKLSLAQSKHEEAAAALIERTDQALREVAPTYDQVDTGLQQYDAAIALQTASEALSQRQRFLCAWRRYIDRRDVRADGTCHGAHRGGPRPRAVADQRSGTRLCDGRTDVKLRLCHLDTTVMPLHGTGLCLAYR